MLGQDYSEFEGYDHSDVIIATTKKLDDLTKRLYIQSKSFDEVYEMAASKKERLDHIPAIMPLRKNSCSVISGFGTRYHPILHYRRMHTGVDLSAKTGTPIYATGDGVVEVAGRSDQLSGYGVTVLIRHGYGYQTLYGHMNEVKVHQGQKVKRGQLVGFVGNTGKTTGVHLHYEVRKNDVPINPINFFFNDLTPEEYEQILEQSTLPTQTMD
jgi:murein DD-endopeptidase MepM/ murein hydrolase activator NlpD